MTHTEALQMARGALEIGRDCAAEVAQRLHTELAGYRQHKHDAADAGVAKIDAAIAALDALQSAQPATHTEALRALLSAVDMLTYPGEDQPQDPEPWGDWNNGNGDLCGPAMAAAIARARKALAQPNAPSAQTGGSPEHMLQDLSRELSRWLADKPDARLHAREAAAAIAAQPSAPSVCNEGLDAHRFGYSATDDIADRIGNALTAPECHRLREWAVIGPVQRAAVESFAEMVQPSAPADLAALIDAYGRAAADVAVTGHESAKAYAALARSNLLDAIAQPSAPSAEPAIDVLEQCAALVDALRRKLTGTTAKAAASECAMQIRNLRAPTAPAPAQAEPVAWANSASLTSARISRERGGPFDRFNCSEGRTCYHDTPLYAAPPAAAAPPQPLTGELPDGIRVPLHKLWADAGYLVGRAIDGNRDLAVHRIKAMCDEVERAIRAHGITPAKEQP